ncbi:glycosyltransferase family 4 protein [Domibacillus enclensis]|uniref:Glycosyltransferase WbuB n=1 Tax=Domibacillus enclensis TaxID=1017273 RepID=A0A1N6RPZ2_9BACI|nr:glycosyltransferase family 4 protein [Domibacillus enclensis]OXS79118.1 glycosyltransferase WbuB [Domibacillus enclensis]SIQ30944.1 Glycosyltransferase involved in cell wall bisynthesis [Domibacillus enclensis]
MKNKKKKVAFVINYFYPDLASTGQLMTELCMDLQHDFDLTVIAAQPGYAGEAQQKSKLFETDYLENIKVVRIRLPEVDKTSKVSRATYIFSYFVLANIALLKEKKTDIIYTISQPPVLGGLIGTIGKFFKRSKHVYNIQDFNPEQAQAVSYTNKEFIFKTAKWVDKLNCRYADHIIVVGNDMAQTLKNRFAHQQVPSHSIINNWTDEKEVVPISKEETQIKQFLIDQGIDDKFIVMYSGNIGLYYDLENIIHVTNHFKEHSDIAFVFIGEGAVKKEMEKYVVDNGIPNVHFLPYQPKEFIKYSLNAADVHLVVNQKGIKGVSVPSKIYGVMAAGKPILGVLEQESEAQMLIDRSGAGIVVEPQNYDEIKGSIELFYKMTKEERTTMGLSGRRYLEENLKRELSIDKYRTLLKEL